MNRFVWMLVLLCISQTLTAQTGPSIYTITADSVLITNDCDTAELIIENHTQNVPGFLYNKGRGRTEFRRAAIKLNDSMYLIGGDTLNVKPGTASNGVSMAGKTVQLGQDIGQAGDPAVLLGNREIPTAGYNVSFSGGGQLLVNTNTSAGPEKLQVKEGISLLDTSAGRFSITKSKNTASLKFNSTTSNSPALTFVDNRGFVLGGGGQNTPLSEFTLLSIYPKSTYDGFDPLINIQPFSGDFLLRAFGAQNLSNGIYAGCGLHFGNNLNRVVQLYVTGSGTADFNGGPDASLIWANTTNGIRLSSVSTDANAGIYFTTRGPGNGNVKGMINNAGNWMLVSGGIATPDNGAKLQVYGNGTISGNLGVGGNTAAAKVHIAASDGNAGTAPIKLTAGTVLSTPENGAIEFDGTDLYVTENATRYKLSKTLSGQLTTSFGAPSLAAYNSVTTTVSVAGAQPGDVVTVSANTGAVNPPSIVISAYVTSANTVTLQAYNASNSAVTLASDTYKVRVIR